MIRSFSNKLAKDLYEDLITKEVRQFPPELCRVARRKLFYLDSAVELGDLKMPPGNRLEILSGKLKGFYSIRINDQWRIIFQWYKNDPYNVSVVDYHK